MLYLISKRVREKKKVKKEKERKKRRKRKREKLKNDDVFLFFCVYLCVFVS